MCWVHWLQFPSKDTIERVAYILGAIWFLVQLFSGAFNQAMIVELDTTRKRDGEDDKVAVRIRLKRGAIGRVEMTDAEVIAYALEIDTAVVPPERTWKIVEAHDCSHQLRAAMRERIVSGGRFAGTIDNFSDKYAALPPGDGADYGITLSIDKTKTVRVEVRILGVRTIWRTLFGTPQWTASCISIPSNEG